MKLTAAFLVLSVALLSHSAVAFFMDLMAKPVAPVAAVLTPDLGVGAGALEAGAGALEAGAGALEAGVGAVAHPFFRGFNPLTFILASLGIPVEHLVEGSRKCVTELGPEAVGAVKSLLGALTFFG
ncbi:secretoglobin family 3A member 1 [Rhinolophus ferrumequinum]|uniref:Secretoglobin family 3A member 1 n=1 Tax=Rhinolophus ferrumequinum TaxID=59479 RepID=A0A7J7RYT2_RHIFE|nr:secretoglobin family 3A member 1 [Rhinolophus ferrumequinum]KAF6281310.1 secretoglobin family 3A member 1 [Rhinolophus ferrumequinum]